MTIHLQKCRTASIRIISRWDFGCRKFATCYILQVGPVWLSIDRKRKSSNPQVRHAGPDVTNETAARTGVACTYGLGR